MKNILIVSFLIVFSGSSFIYIGPDHYKWKEEVKPGKGSFPDKWKTRAMAHGYRPDYWI